MDSRQNVNLHQVSPSKKRFKKFMLKTILYIFGKAMSTMPSINKRAGEEVDKLDDLTVKMFVRDKGPSIALKKQGNQISFIGADTNNPDITFYFRNIDNAYSIFTARTSIHHATSYRKVSVNGGLANTITITRLMYLAEELLFPSFLWGNLFKKKPKFTFKRWIQRGYLYIRAVGWFFKSLFFK
jgi:hypothetical protein